MTRVANISRAGLLAGALLLPACPVMAASSGPFTPLAGQWSGGGTLRTTDGNAEQLRCRATYNVESAGTNLQLELRCASASYNFQLGSDVVYQGGRISGSWSEATHNAGGSLSGRASSGQIEATATGQNFAANLALTTRGNEQRISLRSQGSEIADVSLALSRR